MKNIKKYFTALLVTGIAFILSDCKKDKFLNVNTDPSYPASVPINLLLAPVEANTGYCLGNTLAIYGGLWAQYWAQDPTYGSQYGNFDAYVNLPTDNDIVWTNLYTTATNMNLIIAGYDSVQTNYAAIAYFMKAYEFQLICDGWGAIPLSQALQAGKGTVNSLDPKFDNEQQVYDSLVVWVYDGLKLINTNQTSPPEDLIYPNQSMAQWQKFAYTLLLKIYIRQCNAPSQGNGAAGSTTAQQGIRDLLNYMSSHSGSFISAPTSPAGDDATLHYTSVTYQQFPLYATGLFLSDRNITGSATCINYLKALNDPRLSDFYNLNVNGFYGGELQGDWRNLSGTSDANFSAPNGTEILGPASSTRLITALESDFLQAEAIIRGYMSGNASQMYYAGIAASFAEWTNSSSTGTNGLALYEAQDSVNFSKASGPQAQIQYIITQKWLSMCGNQNFEAWSEWRRTGYPDVFTPSLATMQAPGQWPLRLVYPNVEENENTNFPAAGLQFIYTPVWWGKNI